MRQVLLLIAKAAITIALLYFAIGRANLGIIGARLSQLDPGWMLAAVAISAFQIALLALRWREIAMQCGAPLPAARAFRFALIASFFNQVLPSSVGGDAVRIWLFARDGAGWSNASYSVLLDRLIGVLALAVVVLVTLPWAVGLIKDPVGRLGLLAIGLASLAGCLAFIALAYVPGRLLEHWWITRHLRRAAEIAHSIFTSPAVGGRIAVFSFLIHLLTVTVAWCAARAVAAPVGFTDCLLLVPPVILIMVVPISIAGWGVRESALVLAFSYAGLPEADGLIVSVLLGAASFAVGIIGGIVWLITREPIELAAVQQAGKPLP
jgi:uncharacterized membrane protein YbhN (UPF0104 family)